uniref:Uncharacterized protein n=1 Tax=Arundo donax TaxID=35708 RepID=A0A0A9F4Q9_ARUDO
MQIHLKILRILAKLNMYNRETEFCRKQLTQIA